MKITLLTVGSHGDVRPYVALGKALHTAGFGVCVGTHPEFQAFVESHGLTFMPIKGNPREVLESPAGQALMRSGTNLPAFLKHFREAAESAMRDGFDDCLRAAQGSDALIVPFFVAAVGYQIARKLGQKTILAYLQPVSPTGAFPVITLPQFYLGGLLNWGSHHVTRFFFWQMFQDIVSTWSRESLGISPPPPWGPLGALERQSLVLHAYSRFLVPRPRDWPAQHHVTGFWLLPEGETYTPPAELRQFLDAGPAPIYAGFGSMAESGAEQRAQEILGALAHTQQRGILMRGWGGLSARDLPENVYMLDQIPHDWLFPQCRAVMHHCGAGTTATALHAGVPQVGLPLFGDQPFWAQRVFGMGLGPRPIPRPKLNLNSLEESLSLLLARSTYSERARQFAGRAQEEGGVHEAVRLIQRFLT